MFERRKDEYSSGAWQREGGRTEGIKEGRGGKERERGNSRDHEHPEGSWMQLLETEKKAGKKRKYLTDAWRDKTFRN